MSQKKKTLKSRKVSEGKVEQKALPLHYADSPDVKPQFVNEMVVSYREDYYEVSFYHVIVPSILGKTEQEKWESFNSIKEAVAECRSKIIIPASKMKSFIATLAENHEAHMRVLAERMSRETFSEEEMDVISE